MPTILSPLLFCVRLGLSLLARSLRGSLATIFLFAIAYLESPCEVLFFLLVLPFLLCAVVIMQMTVIPRFSDFLAFMA